MIYENVKKLATEQGLSIAELEKRAGIGNGVIGGWHKSTPRIDTLQRAAEVLGVSVDSLIKESA